MQLQISTHRSSQARARQLAGLALAAALLVGVAAPVRADSDFENAFEDQMGRILAFEAVAVGRALLFPGVAAYPAPVAYARPVAYPVPVAVPVAVPQPYWQPYYAYPHRSHGGYYRVKHHGRGHHGHHRGDHCD